jgi:hypothetical protein
LVAFPKAMTTNTKPVKAKRKPVQRGAVKKALLGSTKPRIQTPPLKGASRIAEVADLAIKIGMPLLPWQYYVLEDMLSVDSKGNFQRKSNLLLCARQVGKTWLMKNLGATQFENFIYINFVCLLMISSVYFKYRL